ncbi:Type-2 restriction enzyme NaeI [Brevundimonas sp. SH203]|uniref:NaeI family type II restriction endonuclease n=1 Tax=Brevundimonas sp. SH203 TaxID=345167 RepID=UPI0009D2D98F|nr:NaeI family type II restriction endonuclease [Brevundimonas sp. SH203]GAW41305.1 Type-2 restriction enzyme NaeI [Brevundimonas sp. SH203]
MSHINLTNDSALLRYLASVLRRSVLDPDGIEGATAQLIRRAVDEVIDAPRTKRLVLAECEKTEKTYLGTKIEILFRDAIGQPKGEFLDLNLGGIDTDIKHSIGTAWMIPKEAIGKPCVLITENELTARFSLGLVVCRPENLTSGGNRDQKLQISAFGRSQILWIASNMPYPRNIWQGFDPELLALINSHRGGSARVAELFRNVQNTPIPRSAIPAIAPQLDPLKRVRKNGGARDILRPEGIAILWGRKDRETISELGLGPVLSDEFISVEPDNEHDLSILRREDHLD